MYSSKVNRRVCSAKIGQNVEEADGVFCQEAVSEASNCLYCGVVGVFESGRCVECAEKPCPCGGPCTGCVLDVSYLPCRWEEVVFVSEGVEYVVVVGDLLKDDCWSKNTATAIPLDSRWEGLMAVFNSHDYMRLYGEALYNVSRRWQNRKFLVGVWYHKE